MCKKLKTWINYWKINLPPLRSKYTLNLPH